MPPILDDEFAPLLGEFELATLEKVPGAVVGMWPDSSIAFVNPGYVRFAQEHGGGPNFISKWGLGRRLLDAVPEQLMEFYTLAHHRALTQGRMVEHSYQCPTPELQQRFRLRLYPLRNRKGLLAFHTLFWVGPHEVSGGAIQGEEYYRSDNGLIVQCAGCRHVKRTDKPDQWDFVLQYVLQPAPRTSHGLCPACLQEYL